VRNCDDPDPKNRTLFEQPVIQTAQMFIGEMGCWLFVGGFALYKRFMTRDRSGYQAVNGDDGVVDTMMRTAFGAQRQ